MIKMPSRWMSAGGFLSIVAALLLCVGPCIAVSFGAGALFPAVSATAKWTAVGIVLSLGALAAWLRLWQGRGLAGQIKTTSSRSLGRGALIIALGLTACAGLAVNASILSARASLNLASGPSDPCLADQPTSKNMNETKESLHEIAEVDVCCRLLPAELREREQTILAELGKHTLKAEPISEGYQLTLQPNDASLRLAAEVIIAERQCCPFLQFRLIATQESRSLILELRGPKGSQDLLKEVLTLSKSPRH